MFSNELSTETVEQTKMIFNKKNMSIKVEGTVIHINMYYNYQSTNFCFNINFLA